MFRSVYISRSRDREVKLVRQDQRLSTIFLHGRFDCHPRAPTRLLFVFDEQMDILKSVVLSHPSSSMFCLFGESCVSITDSFAMKSSALVAILWNASEDCTNSRVVCYNVKSECGSIFVFMKTVFWRNGKKSINVTKQERETDLEDSR